MAEMIGDDMFRCPADLSVSPSIPKRVMVIGSCLVGGWPGVIERLPNGTTCDLETFNNASALPDAMPHPPAEYGFQLIQIPLRAVLPEGAYFRMSYADVDGYKQLFDATRANLLRHLEAAMRWNTEYGLLTFVSNFLLPQQNPMGRLLPRYDLRNQVYFIEKLNEALAEELASYRNAFLFDFDQLVGTLGRRWFQDDVLWHGNHGGSLGNGPYELDRNRLEPPDPPTDLYPERVGPYITAAWNELLAMYRTVRQTDQVKLVVVDIDDTLWRGVAAEGGSNQGEMLEGWPLGVAEALGYLKRRGILLGLLSKNDEARVSEIWSRTFGPRLSMDDFAVRAINWKPKAENLEHMLADVNLLPRSVLYIDDNPVERASVTAAFPGIRAIGPTPYLWRRILLWAPELQVAQVTAESAARTDMVRAQTERETQRRSVSREEFLAQLGLKVRLFEITDTAHPQFPRALELINKTNQFNTTTRRWTLEECEAGFRAGLRFYAFEAEDRYTPYGTIGVIIARGTEIAQFVMSCRVLGMDVEIAALAQVMKLQGGLGPAEFGAPLIPTEANGPCRDLYARAGFQQSGVNRWTRMLPPGLQVPSHITLDFVSAKVTDLVTA
jgi:FkbH-like protein